MKPCIFTSLVITGSLLLSLSMNVSATKYKFKAMDNSKETKICIAAVTNDKPSLKRQIYFSMEKRRSIANSIFCNNIVVANFAKKYDALDTFTFLNRYTHKRYQDSDTSVTIKDLSAANMEDRPEKTVMILISAR